MSFAKGGGDGKVVWDLWPEAGALLSVLWPRARVDITKELNSNLQCSTKSRGVIHGAVSWLALIGSTQEACELRVIYMYSYAVKSLPHIDLRTRGRTADSST